jgi:hypothetical protein
MQRHTIVYETSLVPNILTSEHGWVHIWCIFVLAMSMYNAFIEPYCNCFNTSSGMASYLCDIDYKLDPIYMIIFIFDVWVEVTQSVPSTGYLRLLIPICFLLRLPRFIHLSCEIDCFGSSKGSTTNGLMDLRSRRPILHFGSIFWLQYLSDPSLKSLLPRDTPRRRQGSKSPLLYFAA